MKIFSDRVEAGKLLAAALKGSVKGEAIVLAIPRGGVVTGFEVARALNIPLDIIVPRKIGAPGNLEFAIGAVTEDGTVALNERVVESLQVPRSYLRKEIEKQMLEIERRLKQYRGDIPYPSLEDREVILVDDGIATGSTMKAALISVRRRGARKVVVAVPVGPRDTIEDLQKEADSVVCLEIPDSFYAIGQFYENFDQTSDEEVKELLKLSKQELEVGNRKK